MPPGWLGWRPTAASHSAWHAFKFRNPSVERAYQDHYHWMRVVIAAAYFIFSCLITTVHCSSFQGNATMPTAFWCLLAHDVLQALALAALCASHSVRQQVLMVHAGVVTLSVLIYSYITRAYAELWLSLTVQQLQRQFPPALVNETSGILGHVFGNQSRSATAISCQVHLISLAFMGYNHTTIPVWTSFFVSSVVVSMLDPYTDALYFGFYTCELFFQIIPFPFLCICVEVLQRRHFHAQQELLRELEVSQMAESMLNNAVKNVLADAAANIQEFLAAGCQPPEALLQETLTTLARGMRSCRQRQAFLALVSNTYQPRFLPVHLRDFGEELVAGRAVAGDFADSEVLLDPLLCNLVLENAIAQAFQHGHPEHPDVRIRIFLQNFGAAALTVIQAVFEVSFLCKDNEMELQDGGQYIQLRSGAPPAHFMTQRHLRLAADAHTMTVRWFQQEGRVVFRARCVVETAELPALADLPSVPTPDAFPTGLTFYIIDDSTAARRVLASCITQLAAPAAVHCYGTYPEDVHQFVAAASQDADIVICDQHLDYGDQHYLGTDLICSLRDQGFQGLLCMRTSDMSDQDRELYRACGAHCMFGKEELTKEVVHAIKLAYVELRGDQTEEMATTPFSISHHNGALGGRPPLPPPGAVLGWELVERLPSLPAEELTSLSWGPPNP